MGVSAVESQQSWMQSSTLPRLTWRNISSSGLCCCHIPLRFCQQSLSAVNFTITPGCGYLPSADCNYFIGLIFQEMPSHLLYDGGTCIFSLSCPHQSTHWHNECTSILENLVLCKGGVGRWRRFTVLVLLILQ